MKKFSFKKPDITFPKVKVLWGKSKAAEEEKTEDIQPAAQEQELEVGTEAKSSFSLPKMPWQKDEPPKEAPKLEQPKPECPQELDQLRRQLAMWRWIAASCAFAALSAVLLLG